MDKQELGAFLRSRRERLRPEDVGLPAGSRRRTPGLRREEVAVLAHISTEYYVRLEQARAPRPSGEVLAGIAGALRLTRSEAEHLHLLAGTAPARTGHHRRDVRPSVLALLERLPVTAGLVISAAFEVLAWNDLAAALMEDFGQVEPRERNLARRAFLTQPPPGGALYGVSDAAEFRQHVVRQLRQAVARYPGDPVVVALVAELREGSEEFAGLWERHDVDAAPVLTKTFHHPPRRRRHRGLRLVDAGRSGPAPGALHRAGRLTRCRGAGPPERAGSRDFRPQPASLTTRGDTLLP
jgi:transcriptional regulator with XRE-family HTH domain